MNPLKIGSSMSKCIPDIVDGVVDINDVAMVITSTAFEIDCPLMELINELLQYYHGRHGWPSEQETDRLDVFRTTLYSLFSTGRIHQPRKAINARKWDQSVGWNPMSKHRWWDVHPSDMSGHPLVQDAWEGYKNAAILAGKNIVDEPTDYNFLAQAHDTGG